MELIIRVKQIFHSFPQAQNDNDDGADCHVISDNTQSSFIIIWIYR